MVNSAANNENAGTPGHPRIAANDFSASNAYRRYVLYLLTAVGVFAWVDRQILAVLLESIKLDFSLSDTQLGLLGGVAFGLFYAAFGIPLAWLADKWSRRNIIAIALGLWSIMTAVCGAATGFWSLFMTRVGVGVGEAGGSPPAQSLISDYFPAEQRARALGVFFMYLPLGTLVGYLSGGWVNEFFGWRTAFVVVGLPGVLLAILLRSTLREPPRGYSDRLQHSGPTPAPLSTIRYFLSRPSLRHLPLGGAVHGIGAWGVGLWMPAYFMRVHGMTSGEIGTWAALLFGIAGTAGTVCGGNLADRIAARTGDARWYAWFSGLVILASAPFSLAAYMWPTPIPALLLLILPIFSSHMFLGPVTGTIQNLGGVQRRAMAAAYYLLLANLISMTCGPLIVGIVSDHFLERYGHDSLRYSILILLIATSVWAAVHFFLAAKTLREDLAAAQAG
jgi:predicted MFS family arabinose efflux permease